MQEPRRTVRAENFRTSRHCDSHLPVIGCRVSISIPEPAAFSLFNLRPKLIRKWRNNTRSLRATLTTAISSGATRPGVKHVSTR
jgi:hypothetical protein